MSNFYISALVILLSQLTQLAYAGSLPRQELLERLIIEQPKCFARDETLLKTIINKAKNGEGAAFYVNCLAERYYFGHQVPLDHNKAMELYEVTGAAGYKTAMGNVCELSMYGENVKVDYSKALFWCTHAANRGNSHAQTLLTELYMNGYGTDQDYFKALELAKIAGANGHPVAQYYVGMIYFEGLGVPQNYTEAEKWLTQSAQSNVGAAKELLKRLGGGPPP
jgi:TPR repeat protein